MKPTKPIRDKGPRVSPTVLSPDGKKIQKTYWLGKDPTIEHLKRKTIDLALAVAKAEGRTATDEEVKAALARLDNEPTETTRTAKSVRAQDVEMAEHHISLAADKDFSRSSRIVSSIRTIRVVQEKPS